MLLLQLGQVENIFGDGALGDDGPVFAQLADGHVLEELDDVFGDFLRHGTSHPPPRAGRVPRVDGGRQRHGADVLNVAPDADNAA